MGVRGPEAGWNVFPCEENLMRISCMFFGAAGNCLAIRLFSRPVLEASLGESEAQPPKRDLQAFRIDCRMCVPLEFVGIAASFVASQAVASTTVAMASTHHVKLFPTCEAIPARRRSVKSK